MHLTLNGYIGEKRIKSSKSTLTHYSDLHYSSKANNIKQDTQHQGLNMYSTISLET